MKQALCAFLSWVGAGFIYADRPNVLFIAVDDLRPALGAFGDARVQSPHIDRLAESGTVFLNAACQFPVCGPSRASILTGLRPESTGIMDLKTKMRDVNPNVLTLPQYFKENGYKSVGIGKIFDPRCVDSRQQGDEASWSLPYNEGPRGEVPRVDRGKMAWGALEGPDEAFADGLICREALVTMGELASKEEPFFLAVGFKKPHLPFHAPKRFWDLYDPANITLEGFQEKAKGNSGFGYWNSNETRGYQGVPEEGLIPEEVQRNLIHGYRACVSWVDELIGRLVAKLEETGEAENTIIVLWGDHGFHLGDHGLWGKHTPFENAIRAPLIIVDPRRKQVKETVAPAEFTDVFPTLCELAGLESPSVLQGVSLLEALEDEDARPRLASTAIYKSRGAFGYTVRTPGCRYIEWIDTKSAEVVGRDLFDFEVDPLGMQNFAEDRDYISIVSEHAELLHADAKGWVLLQRSLKER